MSLAILSVVGGVGALGYYYDNFRKGRLTGNSATVASYLFNWTTIPLISVFNTFSPGRQPSQIDDTLILGAQPSFWDIPYLIKEYEIGAVINMCREYSGPVQTYEQNEIEQLWLPTTDHSEPSMNDIQLAMGFITAQKNARKKVYLHCRVGRGRSAAIAFCWLIKQHPEMSLVGIQELLSELRPIVRDNLYQQTNCIAYYNQRHGL